MSTNRLPNPQPDERPEPGSKLVVVQTPMGVLQLVVPATQTPDGRDPLTVAMEMFQNAVDKGADDPLMETLILLKHMADNDNAQPLLIGLAVLKQMSDKGMLPPVNSLIEGTGISESDVRKALENVATRKRPGLFEKLDNNNLN